MSQNKTAVCILTRFFNKEWVDFLKTFKEHDVFLIVDDNTITHTPMEIDGVTIVQVPDDICIQNNYYKSSCWSNLKDIVAWDRALYYFNRVNTTHSHVWFLEDDVFIMSEKVLTNINEKYPNSDLLSAFHEINESGDIHHGWNHWVNVIHRIGTPWAHSLVAASRLSRTLLTEVDLYLKDRHFMFIEALFNTLALHHGLVVDNPVEMSTITYQTKWDKDFIDISKIYHPFKNRSDHDYIRKRYSDLAFPSSSSSFCESL
jgi:hypothetical protein